MSSMKPEDIAAYLTTQFKGLQPKDKWGETSFFYNPDGSRPHGIYFATIKQKNGDNDKASALDREGVYRLNFGISENSFLKLFSVKPARPAKGQIIEGNYDFIALNRITPHPVYGWMKWVSILNPDAKKFESLKPMIEESYKLAVLKF